MEKEFKKLNSDAVAKIPTIGVGTYLMQDEKILKAILVESFKIGYRLIDTAKVYRNEHIIGEVLSNIEEYGLKREDIFVTTKISPTTQGRGVARQAFLEQLEDLKLSYVDLVLIHFPGCSRLKHSDPKNAELRQGTWKDLEDLCREGLIKSIGVSNYTQKHLEDLLTYSEIAPVLNQIEIHPLYFDTSLFSYCEQNKIVVQAYSSLGSGKGFTQLVNEKLIQEMAKKYGKSQPQILLRWAIQHNLCIIPKTNSIEHLRDNYQLTDFSLSDDDMKALDSLNRNHKFCWDSKDIC